MAKFGGKQLGAGRPKGSVTSFSGSARKKLIEIVEPHLPELLKSQIEAGKGIYIQQFITLKDPKTGLMVKKKANVYQREPNLSSGEYLINQMAGKAHETVKVEDDFISSDLSKYSDEELRKQNERIEQQLKQPARAKAKK